jgi:hypothetical protein
MQSKLEISNFPIAGATASELRAGSIFSENNEWRPDVIRPRTVELPTPGNAFEYEFPPASVTVLTLKRKE